MMEGLMMIGVFMGMCYGITALAIQVLTPHPVKVRK